MSEVVNVTDKILSELKARYPFPSYAFATEVPNATSNGKTRACDAMAMGCWKTKGIHLHGFEVKVSRSDLLKEIKNPEKAIPFLERCHFFSLVCPHGLAKVEEIPATWGLMTLKKSGTLSFLRSPTLNPSPVQDFDFFAAFLRRMHQYAERETRKQLDGDGAYSKGYAAGVEAGKLEEAKRHVNAGSALKILGEFEQAAGFRLSEYNAANVGKFARASQDRAIEVVRSHAISRVENLQRELNRFGERLESCRQAIESQDDEG